MMSRSKITFLALLLSVLVTACGTAHGADKLDGVTPLASFPGATITIFPMKLTVTGPGEHPFKRMTGEYQTFADTLALLLEEEGYDKAKTTNKAFRLPAGTKPTKRASAFGKFVGELELKTDYALYAEYTLHLERSVQEVYSVIVDAKGDVVWEDRQVPGDSDFDNNFPGDPAKACQLLCLRLTPVLGLDTLPKKPLAEDKRGRLRKMRSGQPPNRTELAAIRERLSTMKKAGAPVRLLIYPARDGDRVDRESATRLAGLVNDAGLCKATVAEAEPILKVSGWPNEQKVLWNLARAAKQYVQKHPPESDYVLFPDYWVRPHDKVVHAVHFVVCDRVGDWVIVDLQNEHHEDYQRIKPKSLADCDRLVLERLKAALAAPHLQGDATKSADANMGNIYESVKITNARSVGGPYAPGDTVTVAYEILNTSSADLKVPLDHSYSRPYNLIGTRQHWIERQGSESTIPAMSPRIGRRGRKYGAGGSIIRTEPTIVAGERLYFTRQVSTTGYPAGKYTYYIEYKQLGGDVVQTEKIDFELTGK
jgi:hypothetical protein